MNKKQKTNLVKYLRLIAVILLLFAIFKGVFILFILILLSLGMSYIVNQFQLRQFGFELVTLIGVLTSLKYGPWIAFILTFILITYHMMAGGFYAQYVLWVIPAYSAAAFISGFFPAADIFKLGLYATIGINLNNSFFTAITSPTYLPKYLIFAVTNILFNALLFSLLAKPLLLLLI